MCRQSNVPLGGGDAAATNRLRPGSAFALSINSPRQIVHYLKRAAWSTTTPQTVVTVTFSSAGRADPAPPDVRARLTCRKKTAPHH
jgi:hypothetical protein